MLWKQYESVYTNICVRRCVGIDKGSPVTTQMKGNSDYKIPDCNGGHFHLLLGHQFLEPGVVPDSDYGIYQWEQRESMTFLMRQDLLENATFIWDYCRDNLQHYPQGLRPAFCKFNLTEVPWSRWDNFVGKASTQSTPLTLGPATKDTVDVLIVGGFTKNRYRMLRKIASHGLSVAYYRNSCWGTSLRDLMKSAKVVLNLHRFSCSNMELARILPAVGIGATVVSEPGNDPLIDEWLREENGVYISSSQSVPQLCEKLITSMSRCQMKSGCV